MESNQAMKKPIKKRITYIKPEKLILLLKKHVAFIKVYSNKNRFKQINKSLIKHRREYFHYFISPSTIFE